MVPVKKKKNPQSGVIPIFEARISGSNKAVSEKCGRMKLKCLSNEAVQLQCAYCRRMLLPMAT